MARPAALMPQEIEGFLASSPAWSVEDGRLTRQATADSFLAAIGWVVAVADAAERADHHPDIDVRWRTVSSRLRTHDVGAITSLDVDLARAIDAIIGATP